jgi:hypothetical protein
MCRHRIKEIPWPRQEILVWCLRHGPLRFSTARFSLEALSNLEAYQATGIQSSVMSFKIGPEGMSQAANSPTNYLRLRDGTPENCERFK